MLIWVVLGVVILRRMCFAIFPLMTISKSKILFLNAFEETF